MSELKKKMKTLDKPLLHRIELQRLEGQVYLAKRGIAQFTGKDEEMVTIFKKDLLNVFYRLAEIEDMYNRPAVVFKRGFKR